MPATGTTRHYKKQNMATWNELAPRYHKRWAAKMLGPLQSTKMLIQDVRAKRGDTVLDVACGTGLVTKMLGRTAGDSGRVMGVDMSAAALKIARAECKGQDNVSFVNADAENITSAGCRFDVVTCQFGLFFFPDAPRALREMRRVLKRGGRIGIVTHGSRLGVPFYGAILDAAAKFIPDYTPEGTPQLDRYSTKKALRSEVKAAGFSKISLKEYTFEYSPGTFDAYWRSYLRYAPGTIRSKIDALKRTSKVQFREEVRRNTAPYTDQNGIITFPWQVLVLAAMR